MLTKTDTDYSYLGEPSMAMKIRQWGVAAVLTLYGVLLIVLFVLYGTVSDDDSSTTQSNGLIGTFSSAAVLSVAQVGLAASLSSTTGALQLGGGTSVYQDRYSVEAVCAKTPAMEPIFESSYVMTFIDGVKDSTTVSLLEATSARDLQLSFSVEYDKQLAGLSTLDWGVDSESGDKQGLLVGIAQDVSADEDEAVVLALLVTPEGSITFGAEVVYGGQYSVNPQITRLSTSSFVLTYLDNVTTATGAWQYSALTRHGVVNADHTITLSPSVIFAPDDDYALQTRVVGLTASSFLLVLNHAEEESDEGFRFGPLRAIVAAVSEDGQVTLGAVRTFDNTQAAFNMGSARVDDSTALLTYCDYSNNFGISVVALKVAADSSGELSASVSAALALTSGQTLAGGGEAGDLQMDLDLAVFGGEGGSSSGDQFVVTYSDVTTPGEGGGGTLTAVTGRLSASGELSRTSPDLQIAAEGGDRDSVYQWHAIAVRGAATSSSTDTAVVAPEIAIVSSLQGLSCDLATSGLSVSMMHVLPAPLGVVSSASRGAEGDLRVDALVSGWASGYQQLEIGRLYYTNTFGELTAADMFCGQQGTPTGAGGGGTGAGDLYAQDPASSSLMTGLVGVAVSETTLLLKV